MLRLRDFKLCVIRIRCPVCSTCDCFDSRPLVHNYVSSFLHFSPMRLCVSFARRFKKTRNWWLLRLPAHFFWTLTMVCRVNNALNRNTEIDERACFRVLSICAFDQFLSKFLASVVKNNINGNMQLQHAFYVSGAEFTMLLVRKCYLRLSGLFR